MVSRRGRGFRTALTAFVAAAPVVLLVPLLAGCPFPLTQVDRPEYNNPVDPGARVPIRDVLPLIPDAAFRDAVIASGVLAAAAVVLLASTGGHERSDRDRRSAVSDRSGAEG